ncbi:hypothetical protein DU473_06680 [Campylobacter novaezeelandiae]|uniref:Uncharacterized protein n=1 Tax=Campylobacter novaezeelandiae TaxID=2267891 RepID=A0A4Q9JTL7_9BACT|nr:hypothetical protein [Campylobacter novaezeelandiae]TBR79832.1 hypothetical protein DU473_06680 [Campylobacter novaezeelandiae]
MKAYHHKNQVIQKFSKEEYRLFNDEYKKLKKDLLYYKNQSEKYFKLYEEEAKEHIKTFKEKIALNAKLLEIIQRKNNVCKHI